jgi:hypothetical protein
MNSRARFASGSFIWRAMLRASLASACQRSASSVVVGIPYASPAPCGQERHWGTECSKACLYGFAPSHASGAVHGCARMCRPSSIDWMAPSHSATASTSPMPSASMPFPGRGRPLIARGGAYCVDAVPVGMAVSIQVPNACRRKAPA